MNTHQGPYLQGYDAGRRAATTGDTEENPYRDTAQRTAWQQGFTAAYDEFRARQPYGPQRP